MPTVSERRKKILLGVVLVALVGAVYRAFSTTSVVPLPSSGGESAAAPARRAAPHPSAAPDVHLKALEEERPKPGSGDRDLFRFKPKPPPPAPKPVVAAAPPAPVGPPPPPPVPPIPYKFIGLAEGQGKRIAVLSDGRSGPVYGREGDIIE